MPWDLRMEDGRASSLKKQPQQPFSVCSACPDSRLNAPPRSSRPARPPNVASDVALSPPRRPVDRLTRWTRGGAVAAGQRTGVQPKSELQPRREAPAAVYVADEPTEYERMHIYKQSRSRGFSFLYFLVLLLNGWVSIFALHILSSTMHAYSFCILKYEYAPKAPREKQ